MAVARTSRKDDAGLIVCQNNDDQTLLIYGINEMGTDMLGYTSDDLRGRAFTEILPRKIRDMIEEYIEYEEEASGDLQYVLQKIRDFRMLDSEGDEISLQCKVIRSESKDRNQWFKVILKDEAEQRQSEALRKILKENFEGHQVIDAETGLPDRDSLLRDLQITRSYVAGKGIEACYAHLRIDDFAKFEKNVGAITAQQALRHLATTLRRNLRSDDFLARAATDALGAILLNISMDSARVVLPRLRWIALGDPMRLSEVFTHKLEISIAFGVIGETAGEELPETCVALLSKQNGRNLMLEVS